MIFSNHSQVDGLFEFYKHEIKMRQGILEVTLFDVVDILSAYNTDGKRHVVSNIYSLMF
jgi:hypothetical protein